MPAINQIMSSEYKDMHGKSRNSVILAAHLFCDAKSKPAIVIGAQTHQHSIVYNLMINSILDCRIEYDVSIQG